MIKLAKSIVNQQRSLVGFMLEGREKDFGGMSNNTVTQAITIKELINRKFHNKQIAVVNNRILEKDNFKINSLPMLVFTGTEYIPVDNSISLTKRFVQNNENVGFEVKFADGTTNNFKYENIINLTNWFKPANFMIRTSSTNKMFISGKPGCMKLSDLPVVTLGEESKAKRTKSGAKEKVETITGALPSGFDILDVYDFINGCGGCIIKLPSEKYIGKTPGIEENDKEAGFTSLGIGEVASAIPLYNAAKLNVNAGFKKVGIVNVKLNKQQVGITTFTYRAKSIFANGENKISKFGIAVPIDKEDQLVKSLGASLALTKLTDEAVTKPLSQVIDAESLVFYTVDTSHIDLISPKKQHESIMSATELAELLKRRFLLNLVTKFCSPKTGLIKELKTVNGDDVIESAMGKKLFGIFATMAPEYIETIKEAGINVYDGSFDTFKVTGYSPKPKKAGDDEDADTDVSIEYTLKGYDAGKISYKVIKDAALNNDTTKVPAEVINLAKAILAIKDPKKQAKVALEKFKEAEREFNETTKKLWMHNASMYLLGEKTKIFTHEKGKWTIDAGSRIKTATVYQCNLVPGLIAKVNGVNV